MGKTRLLEQIASDDAPTDWTHATGTAYELESGSPYAVISDALAARCARLDANALTVAPRGMESDLGRIHLAPSRRDASCARDADASPKLQMHWSFTNFLKRLSHRAPLLLILENLQWADASGHGRRFEPVLR